jgi:hypothetical protein
MFISWIVRFSRVASVGEQFKTTIASVEFPVLREAPDAGRA